MPDRTCDRAEKLRARLGACVAALLGGLVVVFTFAQGWHDFATGVLAPSATGWMLAGPLGPDPVQYWLGWNAFRRSDWALPPGLNPDYGMELASAIFYADIIPLLAFVFKALRGVVTVEQYWGLWLLACGMAQGALAFLLLRRADAGGNLLAQVLASVLLVLQPMLLTRMGGHLALAGQWTILAALILCFVPEPTSRHRLGWFALVLATSLIHAYLLVMVGALWAADWVRRGVLARSPTLVVEAVCVPAAALAGLWAAGFFVLRGGHDAPGYGELGFDLLAWFDGTEWGSVLPDIPDLEHGESGGSYLGLGGIMLLAAAALAWAHRRTPPLWPLLRRQWPLVIVMLAMTAFAVTHRPAFAGVQVSLFEPPGWLLGLASTLRASERFVWPLSYAMLAGGAVLVLRALSGSSGAFAIAVFAGLVAVQVTDMSPAMRRLEALVVKQPTVQPERLPDPFWDRLGVTYRQVRAVPAADRGLHWESVARFAARHGMATDAIYLARIDPARVTALRAKVSALLLDGAYEPQTLYVLRDDATIALAATGHDPRRDLLATLDGVVILAPGWAAQPLSGSVMRLGSGSPAP